MGTKIELTFKFYVPGELYNGFSNCFAVELIVARF